MKNFGFGCMRLPMKNQEVDYEQFSKMISIFLENGFIYFDTAHGYIDGKSEIAIRECLTSKYPRESYILTNKLTGFYFNKQEEIRPLFESQLRACGVEYFDYYLMHSQNAAEFEKFKRCQAYETALQFKEEGLIKHFGISFHDKADVLDQILQEYPQIEVVQIQFNYMDFDSPSIESKKCYDVARKHNKQIIIMEPVKGGKLIDLPEEAKKIFDDLHGGSYASYALRFTGSFDGIVMILSGMSNEEQMLDNVSFMKDFKPLSEEEMYAVWKVGQIINKQNLIACTACRYCVAGCPKKIDIPKLFDCMNQKRQYSDWNSDFYYGINTKHGGKASDCIGCGKCENICPQHLPIRALLKDVAQAFEK